MFDEFICVSFIPGEFEKLQTILTELGNQEFLFESINILILILIILMINYCYWYSKGCYDVSSTCTLKNTNASSDCATSFPSPMICNDFGYIVSL